MDNYLARWYEKVSELTAVVDKNLNRCKLNVATDRAGREAVKASFMSLRRSIDDLEQFEKGYEEYLTAVGMIMADEGNERVLKEYLEEVLLMKRNRSGKGFVHVSRTSFERDDARKELERKTGRILPPDLG